ncbi:putative bifunctional diguanylate cyclase/phosphodiesterase [Alkalicoccus urumqiensis]|nr:bifunctional diguanylate cyclase/phosphodiesterase [Alkalicoccus urumqiensis]
MRKPSFRISLLYAGVGLVWILLSDRAVRLLFSGSSLQAPLQTGKGVIYVLLTTGLLYLLIRRSELRAGSFYQMRMQDKQRHIQALESYKSAIESISDAMITLDDHWRFHYVNEEGAAVFQSTPDEMLGGNIWTRFPFLRNSRFEERMREVKESGAPRAVEEYFTRLESWFDIRAFPSEEGISVIFVDVTERKTAEDKLTHLVYHDSLTGAKNRTAFMSEVESAIHDAEKTKTPLAMLVMDVDRFKTINDTLGHPIGDELLKQMSRRLKEADVPGTKTVYRHGGDEFAVLVSGFGKIEQLERVTAGLIDALKAPYTLGKQHLTVDISMGASIFPDDAKDTRQMLQHADMAMYAAKESVHHTVQFYLDHVHQRVDAFRLEHDLQAALEKEEFVLEYQPRITVADGKVTGVEALVRWEHPERGRISPLEFIPIAEETGYILPLSSWIMEEAFSQWSKWKEDGMELQMAVNLSVRQIEEEQFIDRVEALLGKYQVPPASIEFEITESVLMYHLETSLQAVRELRRIGCRVALDDFGTGYSSLNYLKTIPADVVKIDRSFMKEIPDNAQDTAIVETIIRLASVLNMDVIAEGVETDRMLSFLKEQHCFGAQGYYISRPVPPQDIPELTQSTGQELPQETL